MSGIQRTIFSSGDATDLGAVRKANNGSDFADAGSTRANLHIPALTPAACVVTTNVASLSGLNTYDGYTCVAGDLVLLTSQSTASQNGLYVAAAGAWTRPTEMATGVVMKARTCDVVQGTLYGGTRWLLQTGSSITVDTTSQAWVEAGLLVPTQTALTSSRLAASTAYTDAAVTVEKARATGVEFSIAVAPVVAGKGYYYQPQYALVLNGSLTNGTLRLSPIYIPIACTIAALFAEFTTAGDAASVLALACYTDTGSYYPGSLLITGPTISTGSGNAGSVSTGGTPGVYAGTVSQAITPGVYWFGGVVQGVTVSQPTIRACGGWAPDSIAVSTTLPGAGTATVGYAQGSVTGALPGTFTTTVSGSGAVPRVGFKVT